MSDQPTPILCPECSCQINWHKVEEIAPDGPLWQCDVHETCNLSPADIACSLIENLPMSRRCPVHDLPGACPAEKCICPVPRVHYAALEGRMARLQEMLDAEPADAEIEAAAHEMWTLGLLPVHTGPCRGEDDSNYECVCDPCNQELRAFAKAALHAARRARG